MNRLIFALFAYAISFLPISAIAQPAPPEKPYINVTGVAEQAVVPDEIYIRISITERYEGRDKVSIEAQENEMVDKIKALGININDFSLSAADEVYRKAKSFKRDVMGKRNYELKVGSADMAGKVLDTLEAMKIVNASVVRFDYSKKDELKKELQIEAIKAARNKAQYLLEAIGQRAGKPIFVEEVTGKLNNNEVHNFAERGQYYIVDGIQSNEDVYSPVQFEFRKIVYKYAVNARFLIE